MKKIKHLALLSILIPSLTLHANKVETEEIEVPAKVQDACDKYGEEYGICPELLEAICWKESRFQSTVVDSSLTCIGLMQIDAPTHRKRMQRLGIYDLFDVDNNIHVGADILSELFEYNEDVGLVLMLYHGERNAYYKAKRGKISKYAKEILEISEELERVHGK